MSLSTSHLGNATNYQLDFLAHICGADQRTVLGRVLRTIADMCNTDTDFLSPQLVKKKLSYRSACENEVWRIDAARELLSLRDQNLILPGFTSDEINQMLDYVCIT